STYQRELACDRVARVQPPYVPPLPALTERPLFPGSVPTDRLTVTATYSFDLNFKSHGYLRQSATPANWQSTGLYAPPGQLIRVTVSDATADDLTNVYLRIGVHTDNLSPTSGNVENGEFLRYPNVAMRIKLEPGENLVRSPYGGPIILDGSSGAGKDKVISIEIANAVQAPYFQAGVTTEPEWLQRRALPIPYAEIEGDLAVIHVPSTEIRDLSYREISELAAYYSTVGTLHNDLSLLTSEDIAIHQPPLGKYRHVEDIQISAGWGHSGFPAMYFNAWQIGVPEISTERSSGWGVWHELGHNYQMGLWSGVYGGEVTVNLWSLYAQEQLYGNSRLVDADQYAKAIAVLNDVTIT
ncbi:MAG: M60 family metallopeptidase, partial [Caldilineaceae bacterium]|nr:M60 family metallopeptidase [Caldilineaceae bacterium]